jgi:hypothetical protein
MVDVDVVQKWVDWLEDKKNVQARGHLRRADAHCCLGGLATVLGLTFKPVTDNEREMQIGCYYFEGLHGKSTVALPDEVWEQLGFDESQGFYMALNDAEGKTFKEIAAVLREKYLVKEEV